MKKKKKEAQSANRWMGDEDDFADDVDGVHFGLDQEMTTEDYTELGRKTMNQLRNMEEAEQIMKLAGWMDKSSGPLPNVNLTRYNPTSLMSHGAWKNTVKQHKEAHLADKMSNAPPTETTRLSSKFQPNEVKILTPEYFRKNYIAEKIENQRLMVTLCIVQILAKSKMQG